MLSGFLIVGLLLAELDNTGRISLTRFWSKRARRVLPASTLVLACTAVASAVWLPHLEKEAAATDIKWAALFAAN